MEQREVKCACCGASVTPDVPEYFVEIESFRLMSERGQDIPRRGSQKYHHAMEHLRAEVRASYFENIELYNRGHLWCPHCGSRIPSEDENDFSCNPGV